MSVIRWSVGRKGSFHVCWWFPRWQRDRSPKPQVRSSGGVHAAAGGPRGSSFPLAWVIWVAPLHQHQCSTRRAPERGCNLRATQSQQVDRSWNPDRDLQRGTTYGSGDFFSSGLFCVFTLPYLFIPDPQSSCFTITLNNVWTRGRFSSDLRQQLIRRASFPGRAA